MHFRTTYESLPWLRCKSGAKEHSSHLSHNNKRNTDIEQKNWKPCWVRFPGSEKLGASRNGRMERNFPVIPIFRNFRPTSRGTPKISEWNSGKCLFHLLPNPEFPEFLVEWKAPNVCNFRESVDSREFLNFFIFCPNNFYGTLISKFTLQLVTGFYFFRNRTKFKSK